MCLRDLITSPFCCHQCEDSLFPLKRDEASEADGIQSGRILD